VLGGAAPGPAQAAGEAAGGGPVPQAAGETGAPPLALGGSATAGAAPASGAGAAAAAPLTIEAVESEADTLYIAGASAPGRRVRVYVEDALVGEAEADAGGRWLVESAGRLEAGRVTVRADQVGEGAAGGVEARAEVPFVRHLDMTALVPAASGAGAGSGTAAEGATPQPAAVIIRRGDNLWTISRRTYGRGIRYSTIYEANADQIRNPHRIYPGQVFVLPKHDPDWTK